MLVVEGRRACMYAPKKKDHYRYCIKCRFDRTIENYSLVLLLERPQCVNPSLGLNWSPQLIRRHMFFYQQCIEPSMSPYVGPKSTAPSSPLREQQCQERVLYFFDPGSMRMSRSFIEPWLQCIGPGSILAFIVSHRLRPSHCGCS